MTGDTEAETQAASGTYSGDTEQALGLLEVLYGPEYTFGYDPELGAFWVIKDGRIGSMLKAPTPEALGGLIDSAPPGAAR